MSQQPSIKDFTSEIFDALGCATLKETEEPILEATDLYLRLKGQGKAETFHRAAARACRYLTEVAGDKPLSGYVRADATKLRDTLVESGLAGSSVTRLFTNVKSIFNFACMETGLEIKNPCASLYLDWREAYQHASQSPRL